ncbi:MAG: M3 family oligoendopeptidase [Anaerolineae bacterium]|nr:M3 family oligoendopeptidase [Anaerolineae bacterium]
MFETMPRRYEAVKDWDWSDFAPYAQDLMERPLDAGSLPGWLGDYSRLLETAWECYSRLQVARTQNTRDEEAQRRFREFVQNVMPALQIANQQLNTRLVASGLEPENFSVPLRKMQADVALFREENVPLIVEAVQLGTEYDKISGAQTVVWEGEERTLVEMNKVLEDSDRTQREQAWRAIMERTLEDRAALNTLWVRLLKIRRRIAANAGKADFREYAWEDRHRFDYSPKDAATFRRAILEVVVPAAERLYQRQAAQLGVDRLRPWDLDVDAQGRLPLRPFRDGADLEEKSAAILKQVDPTLGGYFETMRAQRYLDLDNRKGKAPGGYCTSFPIEGLPFIFMNAVGLHRDVRTLLHEAGHAFHNFEARSLKYAQQRLYPIEFGEVASMAMELLATPYLTEDFGGYFSLPDAARYRAAHLAKIIHFFPYMAVVDGFQDWAYTHADAAEDPAKCDAKWSELWDQYMRGVDWSGFEDAKVTGWHRKLHIFRIPFYYIEYGLAQLGALQIWRNALEDPGKALQQYRSALALGGTRSIPGLYQAAGAAFIFDAEQIAPLIALAERTVSELEAQ